MVRRIEVLDHGYVELIDQMGNMYRVLEAARMSTTGEISKGDVKDKALIRYLFTQGHTSPFEMVKFTFRLKMPIFVARQWIRHRTASLNEASARYKEFEWEVYQPDRWRAQDPDNKQSSEGLVSDWVDSRVNNMTERAFDSAQDAYAVAIEQGVAREQARIVMPVAQYTELMWSTDLHNLMHFLEVRNHPHAQQEIRAYAQAIETILNSLTDDYTVSWVMDIFNEVRAVNNALRAKMRGLNKVGFTRLLQHIETFDKESALSK